MPPAVKATTTFTGLVGQVWAIAVSAPASVASRMALVRDLGDGEALILRNHGVLTVGRSNGEAFNWMHRLELACRAQLAALACNLPLVKVAQPVLEETWSNYQPGTRRPFGLMEWPALLRKLDRLDPGYRD